MKLGSLILYVGMAIGLAGVAIRGIAYESSSATSNEQTVQATTIYDRRGLEISNTLLNYGLAVLGSGLCVAGGEIIARKFRRNSGLEQMTSKTVGKHGAKTISI